MNREQFLKDARKRWEERAWDRKYAFIRSIVPWGGSRGPNYYVGTGYYGNEILLWHQFGGPCGCLKDGRP